MQLCRAGGIEDPERQLPQLLGPGYRLDFAWVRQRVAVEIDGFVAHGPERRGADLRRQNRLVLAGWLVIRFTWDDVVKYPDQTLDVLRRALAAGARGGAGRRR